MRGLLLALILSGTAQAQFGPVTPASAGTVTPNSSLIGDGSAAAPIGLSTVPVALGGTGSTSAVAGRVMFAESSTVLAATGTLVISGGNVGLGTTAPASRLDISGSATAVDGVESQLTIRAPTTKSPNIYLQTPQDTLGMENGIYFGLAGSAQVGFGSIPTSSAAHITAGQVEVIRVTAGGNVGIGTTVPVFKLETTGVVKSSNSIISSGTARSGKAVCYLSTGQLGYCTDTPTNGACTCAAN